MTVCIFLGPTMPVEQARQVLTAEYLPPVRQGDIYRAVIRYRPHAIGIIDGFFHQVPSVWHKEILWAMAEGVRLFGSASMGALRAAELHPFGMQGVGEVFMAYRDRILEDDDEVAVVHGPEEIGFVAASEAMVNIRWTLAAARRDGIIGPGAQESLKDIAKSLFYPKRHYPEILKLGAAAGLPENEIARFDTWLERGRIDVKRNDAEAMLYHMRESLDDTAPMSVDYTFEHTAMWEVAISALRVEHDRVDSHADIPTDDGLLDEIRLDPILYETLSQAALLRWLALEEADRQGLAIADDERNQAVSDFRLGRVLHRGADLNAWLGARDLDRPALARYLKGKLLQDKVGDQLLQQIGRLAIDEFRFNHDHERLNDRARAKQQALETMKGDLELAGDLRAMMWYFQHELGAQPPEDLDAYARRRGFRNGDDFRRAVGREFLYVHRKNEASTT